MNRISLSYQIEYLECELADARVECKPILRTYFDTHFTRSEEGGGIVNIALDENDTTKVYKGTLTATTDVRIPITSCIGIASYAHRRNQDGFSCLTGAGTAYIKIGDILRGKFTAELPLIMETSKLFGAPVEKGKIRVTISALKLGSGIKFLEGNQCILNGPIESELIQSFVEKRVARESELEDTWPNIKNVKAPFTISADGIELTKNCFIPIEGFALSPEPLRTNLDYFQNSLERAMKDRNLKLGSDYRFLDLTHKAELLAEIINVSKEFDYISDVLEKHNRNTGTTYDIRMRTGFEEFSNMGVTLSGDCEDGAKLIQDHWNAFMAHKIDPKNYPELAELQAIGSNYIYFMTLATVHGAKAEDSTEHIGAHLYGTLLTKDQVKQCLSHTPEGREFLSRSSIEAKHPMQDLTTLFCEGTGRIRPYGTGKMYLRDTKHSSVSHDPLFNARRYVGANLYSRGGLKVEISHDAGAASSFYLGNLSMITDEFLQVGTNVGSFICGAVSENGTITRGSHFVDLINQRPTVALIPCLPVPDKIMAITREAITLRAPPQAFTINKPLGGSMLEPSWEKMKKSINRTGSSPYGPVCLYARPHQFNADSVDKMTANIQKMKHVWKVDYCRENITNDVLVYRIQLYVDENAMK